MSKKQLTSRIRGRGSYPYLCVILTWGLHSHLTEYSLMAKIYFYIAEQSSSIIPARVERDMTLELDGGVCASWACCNKWSPAGGTKTTEIHSLTSLELEV